MQYSCQTSFMYIGPCDLRPLQLAIPSILRPAINDNTFILSIKISPYFKTAMTSNISPYVSDGVVIKSRNHCTLVIFVRYQLCKSTIKVM